MSENQLNLTKLVEKSSECFGSLHYNNQNCECALFLHASYDGNEMDDHMEVKNLSSNIEQIVYDSSNVRII